MSALLDLLILAIALVALAIFSEWVVGSGVKISKALRISELAIGFILISVLTSLPELMVAINSASSERLGLSIGNIFGSNVVDIALVLGLGFYLYPKRIKGKKVVSKLSLSLLITSVILIFFLLVSSLSKLTGFVLLATFGFFCYYLIKERIELKQVETVRETGSGTSAVSKISKLHFDEKSLFSGAKLGAKERHIAFSFFQFIGAVIGVVVAAEFVVRHAVNLATELGIAKSVVGAIIVAFGTSVPELSIELTAFRKGRVGLALGDALGSTVTNLTLVLGTGLVLSSSKVNVSFFSTLALFALLTNVVFWFFLSKGEFGKREGAILILIYNAFLLVLFAEQLLTFLDGPIADFLRGFV